MIVVDCEPAGSQTQIEQKSGSHVTAGIKPELSYSGYVLYLKS